jgi:hypothetical protein
MDSWYLISIGSTEPAKHKGDGDLYFPIASQRRKYKGGKLTLSLQDFRAQRLQIEEDFKRDLDLLEQWLIEGGTPNG